MRAYLTNIQTTVFLGHLGIFLVKSLGARKKLLGSFFSAKGGGGPGTPHSAKGFWAE